MKRKEIIQGWNVNQVTRSFRITKALVYQLTHKLGLHFPDLPRGNHNKMFFTLNDIAFIERILIEKKRGKSLAAIIKEIKSQPIPIRRKLRFTPKRESDDCITCPTSYHDKDGYPLSAGFRIAKNEYKKEKGPIPFGVSLRSSCGNKGCVNPDHHYLSYPIAKCEVCGKELTYQETHFVQSPSKPSVWKRRCARHARGVNNDAE